MKRFLAICLGTTIMLFCSSFSPTPRHVEASSTVYITASGKGKRYHSTSSCRTLKHSPVISISLKQAKANGLTPCKVCY